MRYLFLSAHVDDIHICCGGSVSKLVRNGHHVRINSLCSVYNGKDLSDEFEMANSVLDVNNSTLADYTVRKFTDRSQEICDAIIRYSKDFDIIVTHDVTDRHPDHRVIAKQVKRTFSGGILTFVAPWNADEVTTYLMELDDIDLQKKQAAIKCFASQQQKEYANPAFIHAWARYNGIKCGKLYAEGFKVVRLIQ